jgi:hypothetical protein
MSNNRKNVVFAAVLLLVFNALDWVASWWCVSNGFVTEENPLVLMIVNYYGGWWMLLVLKVATCLILVVYALTQEWEKFGRAALYTITAFYGILASWNLSWFVVWVIV